MQELFARFSSNQASSSTDNKVEILEQIEQTFSDDDGSDEFENKSSDEEEQIPEQASYSDNNYWRPPSQFSIEDLLKEMS